MAKGKPSKETLDKIESWGLEKFAQTWSNELCAEHDGTIASFPRLKMRIGEISDYENIFIRDVRNLSKVGKYAGFSVAGVAGVAGVAMTSGTGAAPIAAALGKMGLLGSAASGAAIASLNGAALTSASLAAIGGSVAAGTTILSASGLALGGIAGGVIANNYYSDDKSFNIKKLTDNEAENRTVFINGFTQENETNFHDWQIQQLLYDSNHIMYGVNWASKTNAKIGSAFALGLGKNSARSMLAGIAASGGKAAASKLTPVSWLLLVRDLATNPWHSAMMRAAQTGVQVAEAISRTDGQKYNLVGHSLGCRVIYYALLALGTKKEKYINDVILLGGAVGKDDQKGWSKALKAVSGRLYNCHSCQDGVLKALYRTANAGLSSPIGISPLEIKNSSNVININCDNMVGSHFEWKENFSKILQRINA